MSGYQTVLVGTDGSESSFRAVERAAVVARDSRATLLIACAYHPISQREAEQAQDVLRDEAYQVVGSAPAEDTLRRAADLAKRNGAEAVESIPVEGSAVDSLVDLAAKRQVDLVVVGNRGLNTLAGRLLGSVPSGVARQAGCDVLIVHTVH